MRIFDNIHKQLTGINKIAFGFNGIVFNGWGNNVIRKFGIMDAIIIGFNVTGKIFADKPVKQGSQHVLLKVPAINGAANIVGDLPDLTL